jgi:hypothetical protein
MHLHLHVGKNAYHAARWARQLTRKRGTTNVNLRDRKTQCLIPLQRRHPPKARVVELRNFGKTVDCGVHVGNLEWEGSATVRATSAYSDVVLDYLLTTYIPTYK